MAYPRLKKNDNPIHPSIDGALQERAFMDETNKKDVFTPHIVELRDIDEQISLLLESGVLSITADGIAVPVTTVDTERWAEFAKTWHIKNEDGNVSLPLIAIRRVKEEVGTMLGPRYNIPNKKFMTTLKVPTFENGIPGVRLFQMRQPTHIDCIYEVRLIAQYKEDSDEMAQSVLREYTDRQLYIKVKGYYFPTTLEDMDDESTMEDIDADRYYVKTFMIRAQCFIQRLEDFQEIDAPNRIITMTEFSGVIVNRSVTNLYGSTSNQ